MQVISSAHSTFFSKRIFPIIWFGAQIAMGITIILSHRANANIPLLMLMFPLFMALIGYVLMKKLVFDLVDEVLDGGDALLVRAGAIRERIELSNIINVSYAGMTNPRRVTLTLRHAGALGSEVTFSPRQQAFQWNRNAMVEELIQRVDAARRAAPTMPENAYSGRGGSRAIK